MYLIICGYRVHSLLIRKLFLPAQARFLPANTEISGIICNSRNLIGLVVMVYEPTNMVSVRVILGRYCFYFSLLFYILGAFLMKQLFYSRLLDMR